MAQSIGIAALSILVGAFVLSILVIESKALFVRLRKRKSPKVTRSFYE